MGRLIGWLPGGVDASCQRKYVHLSEVLLKKKTLIYLQISNIIWKLGSHDSYSDSVFLQLLFFQIWI